MMDLVVSTLRQIRSDNRGVTALEYGLIASLIAVVIIVGVSAIGTAASVAFSSVAISL